MKGAVQGFIGIAQGVVSAVEAIVGTLQSLYDKAVAIKNLVSSGLGGSPGSGGQGGAPSTGKGHVGRHAMGGIIMQPILAGNQLFGEAGREAVIPLDNQTGRNALAQAMPEIHVYIGGKPIRDEVQVVLKGTARTVKAGRKW